MATQGSSLTQTFENDTSTFEWKEKRKSGFGKFHVEAAEMINLKLAKRIATYFEFNKRDVGILNEDDDPGLELLSMMRTRGLITPTDISNLIECLKETSNKGIAEEIQSSFEKNGCRKLFSSQEEGTLQEASFSWKESFSSEETADCMDGDTPKTESSLQSSKKRKIVSTDENRRVGKKSSHRLSSCSESQIVYVLKQSEHVHTSPEGSQRVNKNEYVHEGRDRKPQFDKLDQDEENSHKHRGSDNDEGENNDDEERKDEKRKDREDRGKKEEGNCDRDVKYHDDVEQEEIKSEHKHRQMKKKDNKKRECSKDGTPGNNERCSAEDEEDGGDERGILVAAVLEGKNQEVKMLYVTRDRLQTKVKEGQIFNIRNHMANQDNILLTMATKIMKTAQDELFQDISSEKKTDALTSLRNSKSTIELPGSNVKEVKYKLPGKTPVISLKAVVTKIALHVGYSEYTDSFERKAYFKVADSEKDRLTVISHDKHVSTSKLREGTIVKLLKFETHRGEQSRYYADSNCLVSRKGSDVKLISHEGLKKLQVLLPLTDSYQVEGKLLRINVDLDTYEACPRQKCYEKKVEANQKGCFYCKKCGETYERENIVEGFFLELTVSDGKDKEYIIFKSTMTSTLQELKKSIPVLSKDLTEMFEECFFGEMIRMVVKPSDGPSNDVITSMQALM